MFNPNMYAGMMGQAAQAMAGAGQAGNATSNPMANYGGMGAMNPSGLASMTGMSAGMQQPAASAPGAAGGAPASAMSNPAMAALAQNPAAMQQMQAMYQVFSCTQACIWAAAPLSCFLTPCPMHAHCAAACRPG